MDQATELRQLVAQGGISRAPARAPYLVTVTGGKGGVGTTTMAVQLARAVARSGVKATLVDADFNRPDATKQCGIDADRTLIDVMQGRLPAAEALRSVEHGLLLLPGAWPGDEPLDCSPLAQGRLLSGLQSLAPHAEMLIVDAGNGNDRVVRRFWQAADHVLVVTTPENTALMNAYAAIKLAGAARHPVPVRTLVNDAEDDSAADEVHLRIAHACRRFLGLRVETLGTVLHEEQSGSFGRIGRARFHDMAQALIAAAELRPRNALRA